METAFLSNEKNLICFEAKGRRIRFKGPYSLEKIIAVKEWDVGYIVFDAKFSHQEMPVEDYIDLVSILEDLLIDPQSYLESINKVEVRLNNDDYAAF